MTRAGLVAAFVAVLGISALAVARTDLRGVADALGSVDPAWTTLTIALMATSMLFRSEAWCAVVRSALPHRAIGRADVARATMIGVFVSAVVPGRVGEPARAIVLSRRLGRLSSCLPIVVGTLFSQMLLNVLGLLAVAAIAIVGSSALAAQVDALALVAAVPAVLLLVVLTGPWILERISTRSALLRKVASVLAVRLSELRGGLRVFRRVPATSHALSAQLAAWALQLLSVYALLAAFDLTDRAGIGAAAAVLTAVNVTGIVPVTPSNIGIFQATCVVALAGWGIGTDAALAYGIALQGIEMLVAVALGVPALAREHTSLTAIRRTAEHMPYARARTESGVG
jgi:phosphatidyl-myo-inositol alpha-mannosyltransferase